MESRRFKDIIAFRTPEGPILGFHARNLEVAELSEQAWRNLAASNDNDIQTELNQWSEQPIAFRRPELPAKIRSLNINVTQVCNLQCVYCAAGGDGTYGDPIKRISVEKTLPQLKWFFEKLSADDKFSITFLGGEPLLYTDGMAAIADYCQSLANQKNVRLDLRVVTNGTLFTENAISLLNTYRISVTLSLDGPPETNDKARPGLGGKPFSEQIARGLQMLMAQRSRIPEVSVRGVFGKYNLDVMAAYKYYSRFDFDRYDFNFDVTCDDKQTSDRFVEGMTEVAACALESDGENALRKIYFFDTVFDRLDNQKRIENYCGSGKSLAILDSANQAFRCPWEVADKVELAGRGTDLRMEKFQTIEKTLVEQNNCQNCWARYLCGGGCMYAHRQTTGSKHTPDPVYCDRTRSLLSRALMYYYSLRKVTHEHSY